MAAWLPIGEWLPRLSRDDARADAVAGLTTAVLLVPQGMGYAMLAGLPPVAGLYAALVPLITYAAFGSSRELAIGPIATDSMLTAVTVATIAQAGTERYLEATVLLGALVGAIQLLLGTLRLGFVVNFLSRPVLSGFTSAVALIIFASQLEYILGVRLPHTHHVHLVLAAALRQAGAIHVATAVLGTTSVVALLLFKRHFPKLPRAMIGVAAATAAVALLRLDERGVAIVGEVPAGLPVPRLAAFETSTVTALLPGALTLALVGFIEAISVGKQFATRRGYDIRPNQELVALGLSNMGGALFGGYPVTSGFSRTALNAQAGARSQLSGLVTAAVLASTLLLLTPLFFYLPKAVLAAIIMTAVLGLVDLAEPRHLWRVKRSDFWLLAFTFVATLGLGIMPGVLSGVAASLGLFLVRTTRPHFAVLGRIPGSDAYLNVERHPHAVQLPGVLVLRIDAQFYFGNVSFLKETLRRLERQAREKLRAVVLDASGINQLDSSALSALNEIDRDYARRGIRLLFARVKGPVRDVMARSGMLEQLGREGRIYLRTHDAVAAAEQPELAPRLSSADDPRAPADRVGCDAFPGPE